MRKKMTLDGFFKLYRENLKNKNKKKKTCLFFLANILSLLSLPSEEEMTQLPKVVLSEPVLLRYFLEPWIKPSFDRLTDESYEHLRNTLAYYLNHDDAENILSGVLDALALPIEISSAKTFYTMLWQCLFNSEFPSGINLDEYEEDRSEAFVNALKKNPPPETETEENHDSGPYRIGDVPTELVSWYDSDVTDDELKTRAESGIRDNQIFGVPGDASRWISRQALLAGIAKAQDTYEKLRKKSVLDGTTVYVEEITLTFPDTIATGFKKGGIKATTKTAQFVFSEQGELLVARPLFFAESFP